MINGEHAYEFQYDYENIVKRLELTDVDDELKILLTEAEDGFRSIVKPLENGNDKQALEILEGLRVPIEIAHTLNDHIKSAFVAEKEKGGVTHDR